MLMIVHLSLVIPGKLGDKVKTEFGFVGDSIVTPTPLFTIVQIPLSSEDSILFPVKIKLLPGHKTVSRPAVAIVCGNTLIEMISSDIIPSRHLLFNLNV